MLPTRGPGDDLPTEGNGPGLRAAKMAANIGDCRAHATGVDVTGELRHIIIGSIRGW